MRKLTLLLLILLAFQPLVRAQSGTFNKLFVFYIDRSTIGENDRIRDKSLTFLNEELDSVSKLDHTDMIIMLASNRKDTNAIFFKGPNAIDRLRTAITNSEQARPSFTTDAIRLRRQIYDQVDAAHKAAVSYSYKWMYLKFFMPQSQAEDLVSRYNPLYTLVDEMTSTVTNSSNQRVDFYLPALDLRSPEKFDKAVRFYQDRNDPTYSQFASSTIPVFHLF